MWPVFSNTRELLLFLLVFVPVLVAAQPRDTILRALSLENMDEFRAGANWQVAGHVVADRRKRHDLTAGAGTGILVNLPTSQTSSNLVTSWEHGDLRLEMDIMVPRGSNSGIYLQGRYEIQILDSWGVEHPDYGDMGGIYHRWDASRPEGNRGFQGKPPRVNVARAPGLWQYLTIEFRAPRFNASGEKIQHAVFKKVMLNGVVIHENVQVTGPTRGPAFEGEAARASMVIQGDHGPVAFRNINFRRYDRLPATVSDSTDRQQPPDPILVEPTDGPRVVRSFMNHRGKKRTHVVSVGDPAGIHYTYDLVRPALIKMWKGPFLETTKMWHGRGIEQTAEPLGSVINRPAALDLAALTDDRMAWPDSLGPDMGYEYLGYELAPGGHPTFEYRLNDTRIEDEIRVTDSLAGLTRTLCFEGPASNVWVRVARGEAIFRQPDGSYRIDGPSYYLDLGDIGRSEPVIRSRAGGQELLLRVLANDPTISYTMIW